jgi:acyl-CoA dehydrogenase
VTSIVRDSGERALLPPFTDEHEQLRQTIERWVRTEIVPHVDEWEAAREFPRALYSRAGELGFLGLKYPVELGGQGGDYVHDAVWAEELAAAGASGGVGAGLGAHTGIATPPVFRFGTPDQHERFLRPAIAGERIAALGITEPGAGSDVASIRTEARKVPGGYVVNGAKTFITNGVRADFLICAVKTTQDGGHQGLSFLILEREMPGYVVSRKLEKMGWHSSDTGELSFTDVEVPDENLLGEENRGFYLIMENFAWERLLMALGAVGGMRRLLAVAIAYATEREAFGRPIGSFQAIRHKIAEIGVKAEVGRALTYHALRRFAAGEEQAASTAAGVGSAPEALRLPVIAEVTKAKLYTQRACVEVADEVVQILGGYGYMREYGVERALRDARLGPIGGGTDEVMKEILGKQLGL